MGVFSFTIIDETNLIDPARLFKAFILDNHDVLPKVAPHVIKSVDFVEGDSVVVGCVRQTNLVDGKYFKSRLDEIDVEKASFKFTTFEDNDLDQDLVEFVVYEGKVKAYGTGTHYKSVSHFHAKGDVILTEEHVKRRLQGGSMVFKAVPQYLINNPLACT